MLRADQAPYFETCPRCGMGGLDRLKTHAYCVNCNYDEYYQDEICPVPQWVIDVLKAEKPKSNVKQLRENENNEPVFDDAG